MKNNNTSKTPIRAKLAIAATLFLRTLKIMLFFTAFVILIRKSDPSWTAIGMAYLLVGASVLFNFISAAIDSKIGYYRCKHCGHIHAPSRQALQDAAGTPVSKHLLCPSCQKKVHHRKTFQKPEDLMLGELV